MLLVEGMRAEVADFEFVSALPETVGSTTVVTAAGALCLTWSRGYIAPEVTDGKHGAASDVYSYGVVSLLYIIIYRLFWRRTAVFWRTPRRGRTQNWCVCVIVHCMNFCRNVLK